MSSSTWKRKQEQEDIGTYGLEKSDRRTHLCDDVCIVQHISHFRACLEELLHLGIRQNELSGQLRAGVGEGGLHEGAAQDTAHHLRVSQQLALHLALECGKEARPAVCQAKAV